MQDLPIGIQTFENLIRGNFLYVDKTKDIYHLIRPARGVYFLSRPRRFGKSLLVTTLAAIFEGKRELFKGLWLAEQTDYAFEPHPVIQIDFSRARLESAAELKTHLLHLIDECAAKYQVELSYSAYYERFAELIQKLGQQQSVVILIDEYDKPILDNLNKPDRDEIRETLKGFYTTIKASDAYIRFVLLTGVTKFAKISVFSGLNNLLDISMDKNYAELLGITQTELEYFFADRLAALGQELNLTHEALLEKIRFWYNGYRFSPKESHVYNPFSTLLLFKQKEFKYHWFETGTPTFLLELIKKNPESWSQIPDEKIVPHTAFSTYDLERLQTLPLLFQTGYLTIRDIYPTEPTTYKLDYPNFEVKSAFLSELLDHFTEVIPSSGHVFKLLRLFQAEDLGEVLEELKLFFANIPYTLHIKHEKYYQSIFFAIFQLLGFNIQAEVTTNRGRIDAVVETAQTVYLFEFKLFGTKEEALAQIKRQKYYEKYLARGKPLVLVGVEFDSETRNLGDWLIER